MPTRKKIVIIGPESTGKSTLTKMLAAHYDMPFVKEYARDYIAQLDRDYEASDLLKIARGQLESEDKAPPADYLFCDTDLYVIKVWSEHKYNHCEISVLQQIAKRKYDLYLLTDIDMPWEPDPQREYPSPLMRSYFFNIYKDIVIHSGYPWELVSGSPENRLSSAIRAIKKHLY